MIRMSKQLIEHIEKLYSSRADFAKMVDIEEATLSRLMRGLHEPSADTIGKIQSKTGFDFEKAWEITE